MTDDRFRRAPRLDVGGGGELDEEMAFHIERITDELVRSGMPFDEARGEALRRFGDPGAVKRAVGREDGRARTTMARWVDVIRQDVGFAIRQVVRRPLVNALAVTTLVLGVGATAVVFSVVNAVVLEPLPYLEPDRLVQVSQLSPQGRPYSISEANFLSFERRQRSMNAMAGIGFGEPVWSEDGSAESLKGLRVSDTYFELLGIEPILGRTFRPEEDVRDGPDAVVILSEASWEQRFARDPNVLGRTLRLDGVAREVIGVVRETGPWTDVEVLTPLSPEPVAERDNQIIESIGRLAPGVRLEDARAEFDAIAAQLSDEFPASNDRWGVRVQPLRDWWVGERVSRLGYFLLAAVGLLLLMACVSVANLRVAQASARLQEMGVRAALGAGRRRIATQLLVEGGVLALLGGSFAVLLSYQALPLVKALGPADMARLEDATIAAPVLVVAAGSALLAVLVSGLAPALMVARSGVFDSLRAVSGRTGTPGARLRNGLVVAQFALAVTVALGAGLMTRSFVELQSVELGFEPEGLVAFKVRLTSPRFERADRYPQVVRLMEELEAVPGVTAAGVTHAPPFGWMTSSNFVARSDAEPDRQEDFLPVAWRAVAGSYFEATGVPLLKGRLFRPEDNLGDPPNPPVIVDQVLAETLFPGEDPIGKRVTWFLPGGRQCEIVGVVGSVRDERLDTDPRPRIYRTYGFTAWHEPGILVRTIGDPAALVPAIRAAALRVDSEVPAMSPVPVRTTMRETVAWPRFTMQLLTAFSIATMVLAAFGIYGVTAFVVNNRRREIGLRVALGARPSGVVGMVLGKAMRLAALGIGAGFVLALGFSRLMRSVLYEVSATDATTYGLVAVTLATVAFFAAWVPARRAVRVSPRDAMVAD